MECSIHRALYLLNIVPVLLKEIMQVQYLNCIPISVILQQYVLQHCTHRRE